MLKGINLQPRIFYIGRLLFRIREKVSKIKFKKFVTTEPALQEMLRTSLSKKEKALRGNLKITKEKFHW